MRQKQKRKYNAYAIAFKRGRSTGHMHQKILAEIVTALQGYGKMWYDHILLPAVPLSLEPTPVKIPHLSASPDVVILTDKGKEEMYMIQVQRVYPVKRRPKSCPSNIPEDYRG